MVKVNFSWHLTMTAYQLLIMTLFTGVVLAIITEKDLEEQLGLDIKEMKKVTFNDYLNGMGVGRGSVNCQLSGGLFGDCCRTCDFTLKKNSPPVLCKDYLNLRCSAPEGLCECQSGYFLNEKTNGCEHRPKKELGEFCTPNVDNCYVAFAECRNHTCVCSGGFVAENGVCKPLTGGCPYETPHTSDDGSLTLCYRNEQTCPKGYFCLFPSPGENHLEFPGTKFYKNGVEVSHCCPLLPDIPVDNRERIRLGQFCRYGEAPPNNFDCPLDRFYFDSTFLQTCCQSPCQPQAAEAVVLDGKCVFGYDESRINSTDKISLTNRHDNCSRTENSLGFSSTDPILNIINSN